MSSDLFKDVGAFHAKFKLAHYGDGAAPSLLDHDVLQFRFKFMEEELLEFEEASIDKDLNKAADALADLVYVALGTAHLMGLPFGAVWREVQRANMTKVRASGANDPLSTRNHALDVVKPPGFMAPDHTSSLLRATRIAHEGRSVTRDLKWDRWVLGLANYVSTASKDPSTKLGAVVVARDDRRRVAWGYNGFPPGIADDARLDDRGVKYDLIMHAEENALANATFDVVGSTLYCPVPPCRRCARVIAARRVARVVTGPHPAPEPGRWTEEIAPAQALLEEAGIKCDVVEEP
jgi:dCMP deaminase